MRFMVNSTVVTFFSLFLMLGGLANASDAVPHKNAQLFARADKMLGNVDAHLDTELDTLVSDLESLQGDEQYIAQSFLAYASLRKKYSMSDKDIFQYTKNAAEKGHALSQNNLAYCLGDGIGCKQNEEEAAKCYREAAMQGYAPAQNSLGRYLRYGIGCKQNEEEAVKWYRKAADQGHAAGQSSLGDCLEYGIGCEKNEEEAVKWFRKAAEQGDSTAQNNLGNCFFRGIGCVKNEKEAVKWFRKAAEQGCASGQYNFGCCLQYGIGCEKDGKEAVKWFRKAAEQGNTSGQNSLGHCLRYGIGCEKNEEKAVKWYSKAAEQGDALGQYDLGYCLQYGIGCVKNEKEAVKWFREAADQGCASGQNGLGYCLQHGVGCEKNENEAFKWYCKAADQGDVLGQYNLGYCLKNGIGCEKNEEKAVKWFRKAAEQGNALGQYNLGFCLQHGVGCEQNEEEAVKWYRKAADQGKASGQNNLGYCLQHGVGCEKNEGEAVKWYRKAADQGCASGQYNLGYCLQHGIGCEQNLLEAGYWYNRHFKGDFDSTCKELESSINGLQDEEAIEMFYYALRYCYDKSDFLENATFHHTTLLERKVLELTCDVYGYNGKSSPNVIVHNCSSNMFNKLLDELCKMQIYNDLGLAGDHGFKKKFYIEKGLLPEGCDDYYGCANLNKGQIFQDILGWQSEMQSVLSNPDCFMPCDMECDDMDVLVNTRLMLPGSESDLISFFKLGSSLYMTKGVGNTELCDKLIGLLYEAEHVVKLHRPEGMPLSLITYRESDIDLALDALIGEGNGKSLVANALRVNVAYIVQEFEGVLCQSRFVKQSQVVDIGGDDNTNM